MNARVAFEHHHHSSDEVKGYLEEASRIIGKAAIPADLREAAFTQAVVLLASKHTQLEVVQSSGLAIPRANGML